jgi:hypothetical protein
MLLAEVIPPKRLTESTKLNYRKSEYREDCEDLIGKKEILERVNRLQAQTQSRRRPH